MARRFVSDWFSAVTYSVTRAFRQQVNGVVLQGRSAEVPAMQVHIFRGQWGLCPLQFLARAGSLLKNIEFYKEIHESTVYISVLLAKPETLILKRRRSTERWNLVKQKCRE